MTCGWRTAGYSAPCLRPVAVSTAGASTSGGRFGGSSGPGDVWRATGGDADRRHARGAAGS